MRAPAGSFLSKCILTVVLLLFSDCTNLTNSFSNSSNNYNNADHHQNVSSVSSLANCCDNLNSSTSNSSSSSSNSNNINNGTRRALHRIEVQFSTNVVQNEYIVQYDGYYRRAAREKYIQAALNGSKVNKSMVIKSNMCAI